MSPAESALEPGGNESPISADEKPEPIPLKITRRHLIIRRPHAPGPTQWITLALLGVFAAFRFWQALLPPQGVWEDSLDYEAVARFPLLSSSFWAGSRPPMVPLLWKLTGTPTSFVVAQTAIAVLAWGFLAVTVGGLTPGGWQRILATAAVLAFACTLAVTEWDWSVLSESISISALAAIFAFAIRFVRTNDYVGLLWAAGVFVLARDEDIWTTALLGVLTLGIALLLALSERKLPKSREEEITSSDVSIVDASPGDVGAGDVGAGEVGAGDVGAGDVSTGDVSTGDVSTGEVGAGEVGAGDASAGDASAGDAKPGDVRNVKVRRHRQTAEAAAVLGMSLLIVALIAEVPALSSQRNITNIVDNLVVRVFPYPSRVAWFAEHGMPDSAEVDSLAADTPKVPGTAPVVGPQLQSAEFAPLQAWINAHGTATYTLWLFEHPGFLIGAPFAKPPLTFNDASGVIAFYAAPNRLSTNVLDDIIFPSFWGEIIMLAIALVFAWRRSIFRPEIWVVAIIGAIGPVAMLLAWQGDGQEVTRHMVEGSIETRLGILLVLLIAALAGSRGADAAGVSGEAGEGEVRAATEGKQGGSGEAGEGEVRKVTEGKQGGSGEARRGQGSDRHRSSSRGRQRSGLDLTNR
jgi:hypothetical protein